MVSLIKELIYPFNKLLKMGVTELREDYNVPGLENLILEIENLGKEEYYQKLYKTQKLDWRIVDDSGVFSKEENQKIRLKVMAYEYLSHRTLRLDFEYSPIKLDFINFPTFQTIYNFLEYLYYMNNNGKKLNHQDEMNVYFSGLDERIVFAIDNFDKVTLDVIPEPTPEFFQKLKKVRWKNKETRKLESSLYSVVWYAKRDIAGSDTAFEVLWGGFICLLIACSALNNGRDKMNKEDVIRAYKTYFKLIKTDITEYKARSEIVRELNSESEVKEYKGYLICKKCGGYYKLQPDESPDDFDKCRCGGELEYVERIDNE